MSMDQRIRGNSRPQKTTTANITLHVHRWASPWATCHRWGMGRSRDGQRRIDDLVWGDGRSLLEYRQCQLLPEYGVRHPDRRYGSGSWFLTPL